MTEPGSRCGETRAQTGAETIHVASAADENYAVGLAVTLASTAARLSARDVEFTVLDCGLSPATWGRLADAVARWPRARSLTFLDPELTDLARHPTPRHLTTASYARLLLPDLLPDVDRLLYLDADLVVTGDIGVLFDEVPTGAAAAAAPDLLFPTVASGLPGLGLPPDQTYANAGVLLVELDRWRTRGLAEEILAWTATHHDQIRFADQDAINAILGDEIVALDPSWNVQVGPLHTLLHGPPDGRRDLLAVAPEIFVPRARIWHFPGGKPWQGTGLQSNATSLRAHIHWWRAFLATDAVPRRTMLTTAARTVGGAGALVRERWSLV